MLLLPKLIHELVLVEGLQQQGNEDFSGGFVASKQHSGAGFAWVSLKFDFIIITPKS